MGLRETITIRPYQEGDEEAILAAFNRTLARVSADSEPRTLEQWRWMYRENPCGTRIVLAVDEQGEVLAHYAGLPLRARLAGRAVQFCRVVDPLSARSEHTGQARRGLFTACGEAFGDTFGGEGEGRFVFAYDLPVGAAWRVGRSQLGYRFLREGFVHVLDASAEMGGDYRVDVRVVERFGAEAAEIFERVAIDQQALVVRDALYLNWRFARHSGRTSVCAVAYEGTRPAGLAVWRRGSFDGVEGGLVCEWLVPRDEPRAARALLSWLVSQTRSCGAMQLFALAAPYSREWIEFQTFGFRVRRAQNLWAGRSHSRAHPTRFFARHFHVALSDTDFA